jgi:hypothetical protein
VHHLQLVCAGNKLSAVPQRSGGFSGGGQHSGGNGKYEPAGNVVQRFKRIHRKMFKKKQGYMPRFKSFERAKLKKSGQAQLIRTLKYLF